MKQKLIFQIFLLLSTFINAGSYYVNPKFGSISNSGSKLEPWNNLEDVINQKSFNDGDTLFLFSGYHGNNIKIAKKFDKPFVIKSYLDQNPIVCQVEIFGENIILEGLIFSSENNLIGKPRFYDNGILLRLDTLSKNVTIQNCTFQSINNSDNWERDDWQNKVWSGIRDFGKNNTIRNNVLKNIAYAIELNETCKNTLVENNKIINFSGDGIRIGGADSCVIQYNLIEQSIELDENPIVGNHEDGIQAWVDYKVDSAITNVIIRGNYIKNYSDKKHKLSGILQGIGFFDGPYHDLVIENNIVIVEHFHGISLFGAYNCKIINNTVLPYPNTFPYLAGPPWIQISSHKNKRKSLNNIISNNLVSNMLIAEYSSMLTNNLIDPVAFKFVADYEKFDFSPKPNFVYGSRSIINNGTEQNIPNLDFSKNPRISGSTVDIGAIELSK